MLTELVCTMKVFIDLFSHLQIKKNRSGKLRVGVLMSRRGEN